MCVRQGFETVLTQGICGKGEREMRITINQLEVIGEII